MRARRAFLGPSDGQGCGIEIDLVPAKVNQFTCPESVPVGRKDHGGISMAPAIGLGCLRQALDFGVGQVFPRTEFGVLRPFRCDCSIFGVRRDQLEMRFH